MKLVYVTNKIAGVGGLQRVLAVKANYLVQHKGYDITIIATNDQPEESLHYHLNEKIRVKFITSKRSAFNYYTSYKKNLRAAIAEANPDIIAMCDNGLKSFLLPLIIKGLPLVYEMHIARGTRVSGSGRIFTILSGLLGSKFLPQFKKVVALTTSSAANVKNYNVTVIPNPLSFTSNAVADLSAKKIVVLGRQAYEKGYDRLFTIWKKVYAKHPDWSLNIYGEPNPHYNIQQLSMEMGVTGVNFFGAVDDVKPVYLSASLHLLTSRYEGFGLVLLEAAECGVPSVSFDCPVGPADIIDNGQNGFLVPDGDIEKFTAAVNTLIEDKALRDAMGKAAKDKVQQFAIEPIMEQWDALFLSLKRN